MSWTNERVALLKRLWGEGKTAAEIAKELGGITRNAVIGKAHRLKLSNRISPIQQNIKKVVRPLSEEKPVIRSRAAANIERPIMIKGVKLSELKDKMCHWPIGDPKDEKFHFCGCTTVAGLPYCGDHAKMAYQASRLRVLQAEDFDDTAVVSVAEPEEDVKGAVA